MPFEISPGFKVAETINQRFARLIREGAALYPETDCYFVSDCCCAIGAAARVLGHHGGYRGSHELLAYLESKNIPSSLAWKVSAAHYAGYRHRQGDEDYRLTIADRLERGEL